MDESIDLDRMNSDELAAMATGPDGWNNVPALGKLARRDPVVALRVARQLLSEDDPLLEAQALRVLAALDPRSAYEYMEKVADDPSLWLLEAMVDNLAVDSPVDPEKLPHVLEAIASKLASPQTSREQDLALLFFRQYPQLAREPNS